MTWSDALNHYVEKIREHPKVRQSREVLWKDFENSHCFVDLGCGNGHFIEEYLKLNPEMRGLGVERRFKRVFKTAQKIEESSSSHVIRSDVLEFLTESPEEFWNEVWIQFPDPWPKLRHEKHRMISENLFRNVYRVLKPGGRFNFRSDCRLYWEQLQMFDIRTSLFRSVRSHQGDLFSEEPQTLFQKKFLSRGIPIFSLEFRK